MKESPEIVPNGRSSSMSQTCIADCVLEHNILYGANGIPAPAIRLLTVGFASAVPPISGKSPFLECPCALPVREVMDIVFYSFDPCREVDVVLIEDRMTWLKKSSSVRRNSFTLVC